MRLKIARLHSGLSPYIQSRLNSLFDLFTSETSVPTFAYSQPLERTGKTAAAFSTATMSRQSWHSGKISQQLKH